MVRERAATVRTAAILAAGTLAVAGLLASGAGAFLVANTLVGGSYVFESVPAGRRPIAFRVDTEAVSGVSDPLGTLQSLMNQWNAASGGAAEAPFGNATADAPYNGTNVGSDFGTFTNTRFEVAWDGRTESGGRAPAGVYLLTLRVQDMEVHRKVTVLSHP